MSENDRIPQVSMDRRLSVRHPLGDSRPVMRQTWRDLLFLHWEISPETIQETLPEGLTVDTFEGKAYLGIVPFFMDRVRPLGLPSLPWVSRFLELNVRTYVCDPSGLPGVWFYSLDANQPLAVEVARRWYHLPYQHARMSADRDGDNVIDYRCRRKGEEEEATYRYHPIDEGDLAREGSLDFFLLERYLLFSVNRRTGKLYRGQVNHSPYEFRSCLPDAFDTTPLSWNGFDAKALPPAPVHAAVARSVDVTAFAIRAIES